MIVGPGTCDPGAVGPVVAGRTPGIGPLMAGLVIGTGPVGVGRVICIGPVLVGTDCGFVPRTGPVIPGEVAGRALVGPVVPVGTWGWAAVGPVVPVGTDGWATVGPVAPVGTDGCAAVGPVVPVDTDGRAAVGPVAPVGIDGRAPVGPVAPGITGCVPVGPVAPVGTGGRAPVGPVTPDKETSKTSSVSTVSVCKGVSSRSIVKVWVGDSSLSSVASLDCKGNSSSISRTAFLICSSDIAGRSASGSDWDALFNSTSAAWATASSHMVV